MVSTPRRPVPPDRQAEAHLRAGPLQDACEDCRFCWLLLDACFAGAEDACLQVDDTLARWCYQGSGPSCDVLYMVSPPGSDYQEYGATCGERIGWGEVESGEML